MSHKTCIFTSSTGYDSPFIPGCGSPTKVSMATTVSSTVPKTYQLNIIPQRIQHKSPIVVLMILRTESRGSMARSPGRDSRLVESINGSSV